MRVSLARIIPSEEVGLCGYSLQIQKKKTRSRNKEHGIRRSCSPEGNASQPVDCWCGAVPCLEQVSVGYLLL